MEGKGPYRIYDPGGSEVKAREEAGGGSSYRQLLEENSILRERMKGLKSLGMSWWPPPAALHTSAVHPEHIRDTYLYKHWLFLTRGSHV